MSLNNNISVHKYNFRPYYLAKYKYEPRSYSNCYRGKPCYIQHLDYFQSFIDAYEKKRKFAIMWSSDISHDDVNYGGAWDSVLPQFFEVSEDRITKILNFFKKFFRKNFFLEKRRKTQEFFRILHY